MKTACRYPQERALIVGNAQNDRTITGIFILRIEMFQYKYLIKSYLSKFLNFLNSPVVKWELYCRMCRKI